MMIISSHIKRWTLLFAFFLGAVLYASALDQLDFANSLIKEKDYFRAISVLKDLRFFATDNSKRWQAHQLILKSYWLSQKFETGLAESLRQEFLDPKVPEHQYLATLYMGLNHLGLEDYLTAGRDFEDNLETFPDQIFYTQLYLGLVKTRTKSWTSAREHWKKAVEKAPDEPSRMAVTEALSILKTQPDLPRKSPELAGLLSGIIPGAGQAYTGHWVDAFQAFFTVGFMGAATYGAYLYDSQNSDYYIYTGIGISLTGLLHLANILGAWNTAGFFNTKQNQDFNQRLDGAIFAVPLP